MPRRNAAREVLEEEHLARRIAYERNQPARQWTYDGLAKRMTDAGCPIQASAIYKIEQSVPRRRITVAELVGFSKVFGVSVEELLVPPEALVDSGTRQVWQELTDSADAYATAMFRVGNARWALVEHAERHPDAAVQIYALVDEFLASGAWLPMAPQALLAQIARVTPGREHEWEEWVASLPEPDGSADQASEAVEVQAKPKTRRKKGAE